jgi:hydrogenase expression/formation protein HypE
MNVPRPISSAANLPLAGGHHRQIVLAHGGGGQLTDELIQSSILPRLGNAILSDLLDAAVIPTDSGTLALTIDSYVVQPLEFPGGDIGRLAVSGTVNDLAVSGARPLGIALALILEEGLDRSLLDRILDSIAATSKEAAVRVVTGDTKVVGKNQADGMYITTAGIGVIPRSRRLHPDAVRGGDVLILNGSIADHGLAVMLAREMPQVHSVVRSDVAPLNGMIAKVLQSSDGIAFMRDPTRGGLAAVAADLAAQSSLHIVLQEAQISIHHHTLHAAEMLGLDPLEVANEGKVLIVARAGSAQRILEILHEDPLGRQARVIGHVQDQRDGICELRTHIGGRRIVQKPYGEQLSRIC